MTVTKSDLVLKVAKELNISIVLAGKAVDSKMSGIAKSLTEGQDVQLVGFRTFTTAKWQERNLHNPLTRKIMKIPAKTVPKFRAEKI